MSEKLYADPAKLYHCQQPQTDSLDIRLKEMNSFNNSFQNIKDIIFKIFIIMKLKSIKRNLRHKKI